MEYIIALIVLIALHNKNKRVLIERYWDTKHQEEFKRNMSKLDEVKKYQ